MALDNNFRDVDTTFEANGVKVVVEEVSIDYLRDGLELLRQRLEIRNDVQIYPIFLSFTNFRDQKQQNFYLNLPTSFFLPGTDVDKLRSAGRELLLADPEFQRLLRDLQVTPKAMP